MDPLSLRADSRVLLLTGPKLLHRLLAAELARRLPLRGIVVERRPPSIRNRGNLKRLLRRALGGLQPGRLLTLGQSLAARRLERHVSRLEKELKRAAERELFTALDAPPPIAWPEGIETFETPSVNHQAAIAWCRERRPDLILVCGTSILRAPLIRLPARGVLNIHSSILPSYRGVFAEFWQVLNDGLEAAGVTVHFVDEGVDTGDVVLQKHTPAEPGVDPYRLSCRNVSTALEIYPEAALQVLAGVAQRYPQGPSQQPTFRARDRTFEKRLELLRKLGISS